MLQLSFPVCGSIEGSRRRRRGLPRSQLGEIRTRQVDKQQDRLFQISFQVEVMNFAADRSFEPVDTDPQGITA